MLGLAAVSGLALLLPFQQALDERSAQPGEWGFRPVEGGRVRRTPPPFAWRPQKGAHRYELEASRDASFTRVDYRATDLAWSVHCPSRVFEPGAWAWRFRAVDAEGEVSAWSSVRRFSIGADAAPFTLPSRADLLARIPDGHPRLFVRPEQIPALRAAAEGVDRERVVRLVERCDALLEDPPATGEPPEYGADMVRGSDPWREIWWGNRRATIRALESAATLAFVWHLTQHDPYGELAREILLACAAWDPRGATGYRYNDEVGMPYAYHLSRTYTFLHPLLTEAERATVRDVMRVRGREMYAHLAPRHLWRPYSSHSNRAWHFLGEVGIAFHDEIPEAADWVWFAANVFATLYPVWSDDDGGWHEGTAYWNSYLSRFTWWADVQREALGLDAYRLPFFARAGDWAMYLMPPGTRGGGFGDLNARRTAADQRTLMTVLATQARNPYWHWYVDQIGGPSPGEDWIGYLRGSSAAVKPSAPDALPTSRCFAGTGVAVLQSTLAHARDNVAVLFKSSSFGTQSHGYEAQNSFLLYAFGERLLIRSGRRDSYGSRHHREWMWSTRSTNSVTVDGRGQTPHSGAARGEIVAFHTERGAHWVEGEAAPAYDGALLSFRRGILFLEPDLIVIRDRLRAAEPRSFAWWLHAPTPFRSVDERAHSFHVESGAAACRVTVLAPTELTWQQTDRFDPPPRPRVRLVEHHLTASSAPAREVEIVTVIRPYRSGGTPPGVARLEDGPVGRRVVAPLGRGGATVDLAADGLRAMVRSADGTAVLELDTAALPR